MDISLNRTFRKLTNFVGNMIAGGVVTLQVPTSGTYFAMHLYFTTAGVAMTQAQLEAQVKEIRVLLNGRIQRIITPAQLIRINNFKGRPFDAGFLNLFFSEQWRTNDIGEDKLAWGMAEVSTFQIQIEFTGAAATPLVTAQATWSPRTTSIGLITKWRALNISVPAIGSIQWSPPRDESAYAAHCFTNSLSNVMVKLDQNIIMEGPKAQVDVMYKNRGLIPQADMMHLDFTMLTGRYDDMLAFQKMVTNAAGQISVADEAYDFMVDFTMTAATPFWVIYESVGRAF